MKLPTACRRCATLLIRRQSALEPFLLIFPDLGPPPKILAASVAAGQRGRCPGLSEPSILGLHVSGASLRCRLVVSQSSNRVCGLCTASHFRQQMGTPGHRDLSRRRSVLGRGGTCGHAGPRFASSSGQLVPHNRVVAEMQTRPPGPGLRKPTLPGLGSGVVFLICLAARECPTATSVAKVGGEGLVPINADSDREG